MHFDDIMCHKYQEYCIEINSEQQRRANEKNYDLLRPFSASSSLSASDPIETASEKTHTSGQVWCRRTDGRADLCSGRRKKRISGGMHQKRSDRSTQADMSGNWVNGLIGSP